MNPNETEIAEENLGTRQEKKQFYKLVAKTTGPIALQNLMDAAVNSADTVMLTFVSQVALGASSLAGQVAFVLQMLLGGIVSGASVLAAQYWGKQDKTTIERIMGIAMRVGLIIGTVFTVAAAVFPSAIMRILTNDEPMIGEGVRYLQAVSISYVLSAFVSIYLGIMRSIGRVNLSAGIHCSAVLMNVLLNACFIFGVGPFPKLGIVGVAIATSITRVLEALVCVVDNALSSTVRLRIKNIFNKSGSLMRDFVKYAGPSAVNDIIWGLAFSVYSIIFGHLSADIVAANSVAGVVRNLGTVVCFGVSSSASIILGKVMGENRLKAARVYATRFVYLSIYTAIFGGLVILGFRPLIMKFMYLFVNVTDVVRHELNIMLYINSYYIMGTSVNTMLICGIFRAGGDVKFGMMLDIVAMWVYAVPVGLLCAFVLKLPEMWVYFVLCLDEFVKMPIVIYHYKKGNWSRNITREDV